MRVRIKVDISGSRNGKPWPARGAVIDLPEGEAMALVNSGMAQGVADVETATKSAAGVETRPAPMKPAQSPQRRR